MSSWINDTGLPRLVILQAAAVSGSTAYPDQRTNDNYPYWTCGVTLAANERISISERRFLYRVLMTYHHGKATAGYEGDNASALNDIMESVTLYFSKRPFLQTEPALDDTLAYVGDNGASITSATVVSINTDEIGINFSLDIPVYRNLLV